MCSDSFIYSKLASSKRLMVSVPCSGSVILKVVRESVILVVD